MAIINSRNVIIENCIIKNAPKSNLAVVNVSDKVKNKNILIKKNYFQKL